MAIVEDAQVEETDDSRVSTHTAPSPIPKVSGKQILLQRLEFKYVVDRTTRTALTRDLLGIMRPDNYSDTDGTYLVRSLYFDTPNYHAFKDKAAGLPTRHKLRIRAYGADPSQTSLVRLEVKSRHLNLIHKTVIDVPREKYGEVEECFQRRILPPDWLLSAPNVSREFFRIQRQFGQEPKVLLQYRRQAFERKELGRIRVNFDDELVATRNLQLLNPLTGARRLMRYGHAVFEIKIDGVMPGWLHMLITKYNLQNQSFSKYCHAIRSIAAVAVEQREA
jgi:hypothetical protein